MATTLTQTKKIDTKQVEEALDEVLSNFKCPFSGHRSWAIVDELVTITPWIEGIVPDHSYPAVMLACNGCGYVALFSAIKLGLVSPDAESVNG